MYLAVQAVSETPLCLPLREVVKKNGYFTVRLTVRVDPPPPPPYGQLFCDFFGGVHLTLFYDYT